MARSNLTCFHCSHYLTGGSDTHYVTVSQIGGPGLILCGNCWKLVKRCDSIESFQRFVRECLDD